MTVDNQNRPSPGTAYRPISAICTHSGAETDHLIDDIIDRLRARNLRIVGLRQRLDSTSTTGCDVKLQSIDTGKFHRMTQKLGAGSISCNMDAGAIELLAATLQDDLSDEVDLVVINRFGKRESEGAGFCCAIERALELGIPVLTVVKEARKEAWLDYGGEWVMTLPSEREAILDWYEHVSSARRSTAAGQA